MKHVASNILALTTCALLGLTGCPSKAKTEATATPEAMPAKAAEATAPAPTENKPAAPMAGENHAQAPQAAAAPTN